MFSAMLVVVFVRLTAVGATFSATSVRLIVTGTVTLLVPSVT